MTALLFLGVCGSLAPTQGKVIRGEKLNVGFQNREKRMRVCVAIEECFGNPKLEN